jgi:hypothetical protein
MLTVCKLESDTVVVLKPFVFRNASTLEEIFEGDERPTAARRLPLCFATHYECKDKISALIQRQYLHIENPDI